MGSQATITSAVFEAFLRCKTKAHLLLDQAEGVETDITRHQQKLATEFERSGLQRLRAEFSDNETFEGTPTLRVLQHHRYRLIIKPVLSVPGLRAHVPALRRVTVCQ